MKYITEVQAAAIIGSTPGALRMMRHKRTGPNYYKIGKMVRYKECDVIDYVEKHRIDL